MITVDEVKVIDFSDLMDLCRKWCWATHANRIELGRMRHMVEKPSGVSRNITTERLLDLVLYIQNLSDPETYEGMGTEGMLYVVSRIRFSVFQVREG